MAVWTMTVTLAGLVCLTAVHIPNSSLRYCRLLTVFAWPLALAAIGWKAYMINASWDVVQVAFVAYFWVETKGLTLEEIDAKFEGKHSEVPDLEDLKTGKATLKGIELFAPLDMDKSPSQDIKIRHIR